MWNRCFTERLCFACISFADCVKNLSGKNGLERLAVGCTVLLWLYLFLPFRFLDIPVSFGQAEERALSAVCLIPAGLFLLLARFGNGRFTFRLSLCDILILLYGVYILLRTLEYPAARQSLPTLFILPLLYVTVRVSDNRLCLFIIPLLAVSLTVQAVHGYFLPSGSIPGNTIAVSGLARPADITGLFRNTGIFGGFAGIVLVGLYGARLFFGRCKRLLTVLILFALALTVYSQSRAAWIGAAAGVLLTSLLFLRQKYGNRIWKPAVFALLISVLPAVQAGRMLYRLKPVSAAGRMYVWQISARMFADSPLCGIGPDRFQSRYMYYQAAWFADSPDSPFAEMADEISVPFCEPLKTAIEQGVAGLAFVAAILAALLMPVFVNGKTRGEAYISHIFTAMLITLLVFSCFSYPFTYIQFSFLLTACTAVLSRSSQTVARLTVPHKKTALWILIACMPAGGCIAWSGMRYAVYMQRLHHTVTGYGIRHAEEILPALETLEPVLKSNPAFLVAWSSFLFENSEYERAVEKKREALSCQASYTVCLELGRCYDRTGDTESALAYWELCARMIPARFEPLYLQIGTCHRNGMYSRADSLTALVLQKKRKVDSIRIDLMIRDVREWQKQRQN